MAFAVRPRFDATGALKLVVGLTLLVAAVAGAIVFVVAIGAVTPGRIPGVGADLRSLLEGIGDLSLGPRAAVALGGAGVGVLALFEIMRLGRGEARPSALHVLATDERGFVVVDSRGIATVATQVAQATRGVVEARVEVTGDGVGPVRLRIDLGMFPGADLKRGGEEVRDSVRTAVERLVGVAVREVVVAVHVLEPARLSRLLE